MPDAQSPTGSTENALQPRPTGPSDRSFTPLTVLGLGLAIVAACALAFCRMYSTFPWYDDDGYLLITLRSFLGGHPLYDETYTNYGPFYYLWRFVVHGLGVPLTHDATRGVALFEWGLCGLLSGLLLRRSTGKGRFGLAGGILVFLFLEPVTKEPSHPQLLAMVVTLGAALAFSHSVSRSRGAMLAGLLVGAILAIKPNLGAFTGLGLLLVQARRAGSGWQFTAAGLAAAALPIALMRAGFAEPTVVTYAATSALAALALLLDRRPSQLEPSHPPNGFVKEAAWLALGAAIGFAGASAFALSRGTTMPGLLDGVVFRPMKFAGAFAGPAPFPIGTALPAALAALVALWIGRNRPARGAAWPAGAGLALVVLAMVSVGYLLTACTPIDQGVQTRSFAGWLLALGTPWAFLLRPVARANDTAVAPGGTLARETMIALAVTHLAIGFPAAGTQLSCGAALLVIAALPTAHDALLQYAGPLIAARASLAAALVATVIPACAASVTYRAFTAINLPGASLLRVDDYLAAQFRAATTTLRTNAGPFVTVYGFNSLYFWTQMAPPTPANATLWPWMLNDREQSAIVRVLDGDPKSVALVVSGGPYLMQEATNQVLGRWIRDHTVPVAEVGPMGWQLRRPRRAEEQKAGTPATGRPE